MRRLRLLLALSACALLVVPALADARPATRSFSQTYPFAAKLCAKVEAGKAPQKLLASAGAVKAACEALKASHATAVADFTAATAPLKQQATDAVSGAKATCQTARAAGDRATCVAAVKQAKLTLKSLRAQAVAAGKAYRTAINAERKVFWTSIRALKGGSSVTPDPPVTVAPETALPSDAALAGA